MIFIARITGWVFVVSVAGTILMSYQGCAPRTDIDRKGNAQKQNPLKCPKSPNAFILDYPKAPCSGKFEKCLLNTKMITDDDPRGNRLYKVLKVVLGEVQLVNTDQGYNVAHFPTYQFHLVTGSGVCDSEGIESTVHTLFEVTPHLKHFRVREENNPWRQGCYQDPVPFRTLFSLLDLPYAPGLNADSDNDRDNE